MYRLVNFVGVFVMLMSSSLQAQESSKAHFYTGSYSRGIATAGISLWSVDSETGELLRAGDTQPLLNPSYLVMNADKSRLYSESGKEGGSIASYTIDPKTRALSPLGSISNEGSSPCYLSIDATGGYLLSAHYGSGAIRVNTILKDGSVGEATAHIEHVGSSINATRQDEPHPHSTLLSPDNRYVFVPDLGIDKIKAYTFDATQGTLTPAPELDVVTPPGSGPRHLVFHPSGDLAFCSLEMGSQLVAYRYAEGKLTQVGLYDTVPADFAGESTTSEVRVSADGKFVYIANRGHNSISVFKLDEATGTLERIQVHSTEGNWPRNFAIDPSGRMMVVGNRKTGSLVSLHVNPETGLLSPTNYHVPANAPTYIGF